MSRIRSILDGMPLATLQAQLTTMQNAYLALASGSMGENFSYTSGEGSKSVTYTRADIAKLESAIRLVQDQIDSLTGQRTGNGPLRPYF